VAPTISVKKNSVTGYVNRPELSDYLGLVFYAYAGTAGSELVRVTGGAGNATFRLTFNGQQTGALAPNLTVAQLQSALAGLSTIGAGNVSVSSAGGRLFDVTFVGGLGQTNVPDLSVSGNATVSITRQGGPDSPTAATVIGGSGQGFGFAGAMYAPFGHIDLTGSGSNANCPDPTVAGCGFLEAWTMSLNGAQAHWEGLGPGSGGGTVTTTATVTLPGTTNPSTTTIVGGTTQVTGGSTQVTGGTTQVTGGTTNTIGGTVSTVGGTTTTVGGSTNTTPGDLNLDK